MMIDMIDDSLIDPQLTMMIELILNYDDDDAELKLNKSKKS